MEGISASKHAFEHVLPFVQLMQHEDCLVLKLRHLKCEWLNVLFWDWHVTNLGCMGASCDSMPGEIRIRNMR